MPGGEGVLRVEEWIHIRALAQQGVTISEIARQTGRDPKTVRNALRQAGPQPRRTPRRPTKLDGFHDYLRERLSQGCWNASVLFDELRQRGYPGQISRLRDFLRPLRQEQRRQQEATIRFETAPGRQAQVDWGDFGKIFVPQTGRWAPLYGFVFTLGYSRACHVEFTTSCDLEHFLAGHLAAFTALGIPEQMLYDNLKTAILGRQPDGTPIFPGRFLDFALTYGFTPKFCRPYRAQTKGKVERGIGYLRQNFWVRVAPEVQAGTLDLAGLQRRVLDWIATVAHPRIHGTHGEVVAVRLARELPLLASVAARPRYELGYTAWRRVGRDGRFSYRGQFYQAPLRYAFTPLTIHERLDGTLRFSSTEGSILRIQPVQDRMPAPPLPEPLARLPLLHHQSPPVVEVRDLQVYEEVAGGAGSR